LRSQFGGKIAYEVLTGRYFFQLDPLTSISTDQENAMANPFVHVELNTTDLGKAKTFYGKFFDWKMEDTPMPEGSYTMISVGEGTGGGMMQQAIPGAPSAWLPYVAVDDIAAATEKAKSLGATVCKDVTEVKDMGWFSIIVDPTGAGLGLWQNKK
jgi:predicted enzyme related to lactoylglutathione lyase